MLELAVFSGDLLVPAVSRFSARCRNSWCSNCQSVRFCTGAVPKWTGDAKETDDETRWRAQMENKIWSSSYFLLRFLSCFLCRQLMFSIGWCLVFLNHFLNERCLSHLTEDLRQKICHFALLFGAIGVGPHHAKTCEPSGLSLGMAGAVRQR